MVNKWTLEDDVNDYVKQQLAAIGLVKNVDYTVESGMSSRLRDALKGGSKTLSKTGFGKPDFEIEKYGVPVLIENKLHFNKLHALTKTDFKMDDKSVANYATNGALNYAQRILDSGNYSEAIIIGVAGDDLNSVEIEVGYVYGSLSQPKIMPTYKTFDFLESADSFEAFLTDARLTETEKHDILVKTQADLQKHAKMLNKLMNNNNNVTVSQRAIYVSGMLLAMQDVIRRNPNPTIADLKVGVGLVPDDLKGSTIDAKRDGVLIVGQIKSFLAERNIPQGKQNIMMHSFEAISQDIDRDLEIESDKAAQKWVGPKASINKQIFTFIYETVFKSIDGSMNSHVDIMGEMYSEFLKYAMSDGSGIGIVLTPPYVTKMMARLLKVNMDSRVLDLATGSAGFLIASMAEMIEDANETLGRDTLAAKAKIVDIKSKQLMGVELQTQMYTLATTNMILRGDGSTQIEKGDSFKPKTPNYYQLFEPDTLLLNPPFSYSENGMPFLEYGLDQMVHGGKAAIIIQDSAGSGRAVATNQRILKKHRLVASIKMPMDTFQPNAGVQTSIYIFEAGVPHDFDETVKFIDFRNDGYKRTKRGTREIDEPSKRYSDILKIYKAGLKAKVEADWNLNENFIEDQITKSGEDWNFEAHQVFDTMPTLDDFKKTVGDYLAWQVSQKLKG